jgi:RHH-type rel operon transcriptional repressor/antitoxin RelB
MLSVRLPKKLEKKLDSLAKRTGRTKSFYVTRALAENFDDLEDVFLADKSMEEVKAGGILLTQDEVEERFGIKS